MFCKNLIVISVSSFRLHIFSNGILRYAFKNNFLSTMAVCQYDTCIKISFNNTKTYLDFTTVFFKYAIKILNYQIGQCVKTYKTINVILLNKIVYFFEKTAVKDHTRSTFVRNPHYTRIYIHPVNGRKRMGPSHTH